MLGLTGVNRKDPHLTDIIQITCAVADTPIAMVNILDRPDQHTLQSCGLPDLYHRVTVYPALAINPPKGVAFAASSSK